jgi:hypothetical protein
MNGVFHRANHRLVSTLQDIVSIEKKRYQPASFAAFSAGSGRLAGPMGGKPRVFGPQQHAVLAGLTGWIEWTDSDDPEQVSHGRSEASRTRRAISRSR